MKIRVDRSDGNQRGGLFKTHCYHDGNCRVWYAPQNPQISEYLIDISGKGNVATAYSWFIIRIPIKPNIHSLLDDSEYFDPDSSATQISPVEAINWFERIGFEPPNDLLSLANVSSVSRTIDSGLTPLPEAQLAVWNALAGQICSAKELAVMLVGDHTQADAIRKRIAKIRSSGREIKSRSGRGYFRPDAPPVESAPLQSESD